MTAKTIKALQVIKDNPDLDSARSFGRCYFGEDNPGWRRHGKVGRGVAAGVGLCLAAGAYIGKLKKAGLVANGRRGYVLTPAGEAALKAAE